MANEADLVARWRTLMAAVKDPTLHRSDVAVLGVVLDRMDKKTGLSYPSMSTIAEDAQVSRGQVIKVLPKLKERGYLSVESGNTTASNRYRIGPKCGRFQAPTGGRLQNSTGGRSQEPTGRRSQASGVDACRDKGVGACRRPELAFKATNFNEPTKSTSLTLLTKEAIRCFNNSELVVSNGGRLARVTEQGIDTKRKWINRCLKTAHEICEQLGMAEPGSDFWEAYFGEVTKDPWKRGDGPYTGDHANWRPSFEYLVRPKTMVAVWEAHASQLDLTENNRSADGRRDL